MFYIDGGMVVGENMRIVFLLCFYFLNIVLACAFIKKCFEPAVSFHHGRL